MKATQHNSRKKTPYGPNIVRAWFDTVVHHALRGLEMESSFMAQRNWTFRFKRQTLEYIAPIAEHVSARDNLEQFLSFFARLWNTFRDRFRHVVDMPELVPYRQATEAAGRDLLGVVNRLTRKLKQVRSDLSLEKDVPFVAEITSAR